MANNSDLYIWMSCTVLFIAACVICGLFNPALELGENQTLYIYSSMSQVIAGVYGLTIAGYVFLRDQQNRMVDRDETLNEIIERIQLDQHRRMSHITILSILTIFSSLLVIGLREISTEYIKSASSNTAGALFISSIIWIAYFVIEVTRPEKISIASKIIKDEIANPDNFPEKKSPRSPSEGLRNDIPSGSSDEVPINKTKTHVESTQGNGLSEFLSKFNKIERLLSLFVEQRFYVPTSTIVEATDENFRSRPKMSGFKWTVTRTVNALISEGKIDESFGREIKEIIRYRNALVHGQDMNVDKSMITRVQNAYTRLKITLNDYVTIDDDFTD